MGAQSRQRSRPVSSGGQSHSRRCCRASARSRRQISCAGSAEVPTLAQPSRASRPSKAESRPQIVGLRPLLWQAKIDGVERRRGLRALIGRLPRCGWPGERRPPQTPASRPTARSSCAVRAHETRIPSPTRGDGAPRALRSSTFRTPARSLPDAGPSLPTIAFRGSSQPHRAWCGWRSLLSLPPPNPSLPHHQSSHAQVSGRFPTAAAAVQAPTKGAGPSRGGRGRASWRGAGGIGGYRSGRGRAGAARCIRAGQGAAPAAGRSRRGLGRRAAAWSQGWRR